MGFRLPGIRKALFAANQASSKAVDAPKGYLAVYVGEKMKRFVIPVLYLNQPSFQDLLSHAEEEFGYEHPMGGLTIPCSEDVFQQHVIPNLGKKNFVPHCPEALRYAKVWGRDVVRSLTLAYAKRLFPDSNP
ncbi:Auxin-induced protein 6B [Glycine soja]|uniref:Auxin-induced protein 6B n=1 Tax=Glycine soja TaxID=3848 RepID=A0A445HKE5_GLYSO|nr:Auxin-induced protein 6B [Glycine soja]